MPKHIRSIHNERIKLATRLRDRRGRRRQGRIIIDGRREIRRALQSTIQPLELFVCDAQQQHPEIREIVRLFESFSHGMERTSQERTLVTQPVFDKIAFGSRSEGVVLIAAEPDIRLQQLSLPEDALVCVLEHLEKPGNLGAILRTGDAAGISAVIVADGNTDLYNHNTIRASLGAIFQMPVCAAAASEVLAWLKQNRFHIFAARVDGAALYTNVDYRGKSAIVLGSESEGLSELWRGHEITAVGLPMLGIVDSLNVSATAAVLFYEALRQRQSSAEG